MPKLNLPRTILITVFLIAFILIAGLFAYGYLEIKRVRDFPVNLPKNEQEIKPVEMEIYQAELFVQAPWGDGQGEVGLSNPSEQGVEDAGPNYGPQSFDVAENGHLFLLDSVNGRVIEYDDQGKYLKDFPIACGGTGDIRVSPDNKFLYVFSWRCEGVYKYSIEGKFLEGYKFSREMKSGFLGTEGLEFDKEGNIMLELGIRSYDEDGRFYQVGKNGDEWKNNNFAGHPLNSKDEYCLVRGLKKGETWTECHLVVLDENNKPKREIKIELPRDGFVYFTGFDKNDNIYLEIQYSDGSSDNEIRKYNQRGGLLTVIDFKEMPKKNNFVWNYTQTFKEVKISKNGDVYLMFSDPSEIKIYKYSKK